MSKILRITLWLLLTALLVWAAVIGYWRLAGVHPDARDLVLYLGVLPLGTFAVFTLLKRGFDGARGRAAAVQAQSTEEHGPGSGEESIRAERATPLAILLGMVRLPVGDDPTVVLDALGTPRSPPLHGRLKDGSGFPVFASWVEDVDTDTAARTMEDLGRDRSGPVQIASEQLRALGLLMPMVQDMLAQVLAAGWLDVSAAARLQIAIFVPTGWTAGTRDAVTSWAAGEAQACGIPAARVQCTVLPASGGSDVWQYLAEVPLLAADAVGAPVLHLVAACHSDVGEASIQRLDRSGLLLSARQPEGLVPGEGAAGVLVLAPGAEGDFALPPVAVLRAQAATRQAVSWRPRAAIDQLQELLAQALGMAPGADASRVKSMVSDADLRKSRATAVAGFVNQALDHLDPETDCVATGAGCGHTGISSALVLLALATQRISATGEPVLALSVAEADHLGISLLSPPDPPGAHDAPDHPGTPQAT